ncbi:MAG: hypothetical protein ACE5K4_12260 [Candidatus Hydrothermarchaeota archaeon]
MRKLVFFLSIFFVSISVFAQDMSSFSKKFSLVDESGVQCLFFTNKKGKSDSNNMYQKYCFYLSSEKKQIGKAAPVEERAQRWGDMMYFQNRYQESVISEIKQESLAEGYLRRLAERRKEDRKTGAALCLVGGGVLLGLGAMALSSEPETFGEAIAKAILGPIAIVSGGVLVGGGIYYLAIPSVAEREYDEIKKISDIMQRERDGHEALATCAARGRFWRILSGIFWAAEASFSLFSEEESYSGAAFYGALAVYSLMRKSRAERMYQNYLREKELQKELALQLGFGPRGGIRIRIAYSY